MIYTLGIWTVREGSEDEFVEAWTRMADETRLQFTSATGTLLRDADRTNRFISFGPWESADQVAQWRASSAFIAGQARLRPLLESFEPHTMDEVERRG